MSDGNPFSAVEGTVESPYPGYLATVVNSLQLSAVPKLTGGRGYDLVLRVEGSYVDRDVLAALKRVAASISAELALDGVEIEWRETPMRGATGLVAVRKP